MANHNRTAKLGALDIDMWVGHTVKVRAGSNRHGIPGTLISVGRKRGVVLINGKTASYPLREILADWNASGNEQLKSANEALKKLGANGNGTATIVAPPPAPIKPPVSKPSGPTIVRPPSAPQPASRFVAEPVAAMVTAPTRPAPVDSGAIASALQSATLKAPSSAAPTPKAAQASNGKVAPVTSTALTKSGRRRQLKGVAERKVLQCIARHAAEVARGELDYAGMRNYILAETGEDLSELKVSKLCLSNGVSVRYSPCYGMNWEKVRRQTGKLSQLQRRDARRQARAEYRGYAQPQVETAVEPSAPVEVVTPAKPPCMVNTQFEAFALRSAVLELSKVLLALTSELDPKQNARVERVIEACG